MLFQKYRYSPADCLFVTDTLGDILEAQEVGVRTVAVDFGYHPRSLLEEGEPWKIISEFSTLLDLV